MVFCRVLLLLATSAPDIGTALVLVHACCCFSPFFLAFQNGLVQNDDVAKAIFRFTDAIPGGAPKWLGAADSLFHTSKHLP
jgi:hypothetical protein